MRIVAYLLMAVALATLLPWLMMAPMSLMAFDAGASVMAYAVVGLMFLYPVWLLYWLWSAWKQVKAGNAQAGIVRTIVGAAPVLLILGALTVSDLRQKPH